MFANNFRSGHEVDNGRLTPLACLAYGAAKPQPGVSREFLYRDLKFRFDMDSNVLNAYFVREIAAAFPDAKFILTVREPESWLDSIVNHMCTRDSSAYWIKFREVRFGNCDDYPDAEQWLRDNGVPSIRALLKYRNFHNRFVIDNVPRERLMILPTERISESIDAIAHFAGVDPSLLRVEDSHLFRAKYRQRLYSRVSLAHVQALIQEYRADDPLLSLPE